MSKNLDITTIQLSKNDPRQGASANAKAAGHQEGDLATIFKCDDGYGYCFHGVGAGGNAYEGEDETGFGSLAEALEHAGEHQANGEGKSTSTAASLGPQEPPANPMIYNRRQADGTFRPLAGFWDPTQG